MGLIGKSFRDEERKMRASNSVHVTGPVLLCLVCAPLLQWADVPIIAARPTPMELMLAPEPHSDSGVALREARRQRTLAKLAVNREREAMETWDPAAMTDLDAEQWRLLQMRADPNGYLHRARIAVRQAASLAQTQSETYRAAELLVLLEHEAGNHQEELGHARKLVVLRPQDCNAQKILRRVEGCLVLRGVLDGNAHSIRRTKCSASVGPLGEL